MPPSKNRSIVCPQCGVLLEPQDEKCFQCGTRLSPAQPSGFSLWLKRNFHLQGEVTKGIVIITTVLFVLTWGLSENKSGIFMDVDLNVLNQFGAKNTGLILSGQVWRLVTAIFLHANLIHIFFNMWAFFQIGVLVEQLYGWQRYLFFYIASGVVGYVASVAAYPLVVSIGASGGIMGLIGVLLAYSARNWKTHGRFLGRRLLFWVAFIFAYGFLLHGVVDNAAHLGGLVSGFLLALPFSPGVPETSTAKVFDELLGWGTTAIVLLSFLAMGFSH